MVTDKLYFGVLDLPVELTRGEITMKFSGEVVLVAGGTGGLGRAVSLAFLEEDAKVIVTYRREEEFVALKGAAGANGPSLAGQRVDVTEETAVQQFVDGILQQYGRLDAMVNTVG